MKMKAAVYYGPHDIRLQEIERPKANPEGAVLKVMACGVCNLVDAAWWKAWPENGQGIGLVRGHEWSGELVEVGSEVTDFKVGDRIFIEPVFRPCYHCEACRLKDYWRCIHWVENEAGRAINGAYAEYLAIPFITKLNAIKLPDTLSYHDLALIEPLALGSGMARRAEADKVVAVIGQDIVGLGTVALLKKRGVPKVIASDISKKRLAASEEAGADIVVDALDKDIIRVVMQETRGEGADAVIQCDDRPTAMFQSMNIVRSRGKIWTTRGAFLRINPALVPPRVQNVFTMPVEAGAITDSAISLDPGMASMASGFGYGHRLSRFQEVVDLMQSGQCTADKLVTHVFPLDKITEAFEIAMDCHESIKVLVEP